MALKHAVLAALTEGEATGYELSKRFDVSVANFWPASPQQIYRELDRLEKDGMLEARLVEQSSRPNKRIFNVTEAGSAELLRFIETESKPTGVRDDLLVKIVALDDENSEAVEAAVRGRQEQAAAKLSIYLDLQAAAIGDGTEEEFLTAETPPGPYLALLRGIRFEQDNIAWCDTVLDVLVKRRARIPG